MSDVRGRTGDARCARCGPETKLTEKLMTRMSDNMKAETLGFDPGAESQNLPKDKPIICIRSRVVQRGSEYDWLIMHAEICP